MIHRKHILIFGDMSMMK